METCNIGAYNRTRTYTALLKKFEDQGLERFIAYARKGQRGGRGRTSAIRFANGQGFLIALSLCEAPGAVRFRVLQARITAATIALPYILQLQAQTQANQTLTSEKRALEEDVNVLEQGVFTYIRTSHGLDPKYNRRGKPANRDAKKINSMLAVLWSEGLLIKRGPSKVTYFRNAECARKGKKLIAQRM
jgi:hypothetical protein